MKQETYIPRQVATGWRSFSKTRLDTVHCIWRVNRKKVEEVWVIVMQFLY